MGMFDGVNKTTLTCRRESTSEHARKMFAYSTRLFLKAFLSVQETRVISPHAFHRQHALLRG
jgi:hypothetical protein